MARPSTEAGPRTLEGTRAGGVVRRVDELGRIVIPVEIRKRFGIRQHDPLEISVRGDSVVLSKPRTSCVFCGSSKALQPFKERQVCGDCLTLLRQDIVRA
jgi:transcriptional pleiotropic regulator of transition state genes